MPVKSTDPIIFYPAALALVVYILGIHLNWPTLDFLHRRSP
jgi:hypothetical protein